MKLEDLNGQKFNRLTVIERTEVRTGNAQWVCVCECGNKSLVRANKLKSGLTKSCGCLQGEKRKEYCGAKHHAWNGGMRINKSGYRMIRRLDHPAQQNGYVQEHRLVMEDHLGRHLTENETVHHKNGIRTDNRIENLELWSKAHSYGQRVSDLVEWAERVLCEYAPEKLNPIETTVSVSRVGPLS